MTLNTSEQRRTEIRDQLLLHAQPQHGVFRRSDLTELGIDPSHLRSFVRRGWWTRLHHGVYVDTQTLEEAVDPLARMRIFAKAATIALPGHAYAFGPSSALLHGLACDRELVADISLVRPSIADQRALRRRRTSPSQLAGVRVHRHPISDDDVTIVDGIPSVNRCLAAISTAARSTLMWAVVTLDSLAWDSEEALLELKDRVGAWSHLRGAATLSEAVSLARTGAQTPLESISRFRFVRAGLPEPLLQVPFYDAEGLIGYADMVWPGLKVIGEADGLGKYSDRSDLVAEKIREDRLRALGWIVVRWTWDEILRTPEVVIARIRRAAALAARLSA